GRFTVTLAVSDGMSSAADATSITIQDVFPARAFTTNANATIRLGSGKATWCAQIEPEGNAYLNTAVIASTVSMTYGGTTISADPGKATLDSDRDGNGVQELTACFAKTDLRTLFAGLPKGSSTVTVLMEGDLASGGSFSGHLTVDVVSTGATLSAALSPNPIHPSGLLTFRTTVPGRVRVSLFDLQGRLVRRHLEDPNAPAGYYDVTIDGRAEGGASLPSGVYFYRIEAVEGTAVGRVIVAR
ncbi:MAG TPA: T9SS type A sorting domain-containing protein, partial [Candidatus Eisenbacteria bacterium]|nr:T9SS type A sorting domain-containing protein [Candidatus Eisenbacteria bacterium]